MWGIEEVATAMMVSSVGHVAIDTGENEIQELE